MKRCRIYLQLLITFTVPGSQRQLKSGHAIPILGITQVIIEQGHIWASSLYYLLLFLNSFTLSKISKGQNSPHNSGSKVPRSKHFLKIHQP